MTESISPTKEILTYSKTDIVVLSEAQAVSLGGKVKSILNTAGTVYITSSMNDDEILKVCEMESLIGSDPEEENTRIATAITANGEYYRLNAVYAIYSENAIPKASTTISNAAAEDTSLVYDGISAVLTTNTSREAYEAQSASAKGANTVKSQPPASFDYKTGSAVIYSDTNTKIGTMGYTLYFYKSGAVSGTSKRIFDSVCISTFAPLSGYKCKKMSVYLGENTSTHEVLEAANLISSNQSTTYNLSLSAGKSGILVGASRSWSYGIDAQTVTKQFDMTTNDRKWIFEPKAPGNGDAWIEEPGIRTFVDSLVCYTTVKLEFPIEGLFGVVLKENTLSGRHNFTYN